MRFARKLDLLPVEGTEPFYLHIFEPPASRERILRALEIIVIARSSPWTPLHRDLDSSDHTASIQHILPASDVRTSIYRLGPHACPGKSSVTRRMVQMFREPRQPIMSYPDTEDGKLQQPASIARRILQVVLRCPGPRRHPDKMMVFNRRRKEEGYKL